MIELKVKIIIDCDLILVRVSHVSHDAHWHWHVLVNHNSNEYFIYCQKAKSLKSKKEEGNTAFKAGKLEEAYKLYR